MSNSHFLTVNKIFTLRYIEKIPIKENENSTEKASSRIYIKKDVELKGDNIENESLAEYGNDFINCKNIHSKQ